MASIPSVLSADPTIRVYEQSDDGGIGNQLMEKL